MSEKCANPKKDCKSSIDKGRSIQIILDGEIYRVCEECFKEFCDMKDITPEEIKKPEEPIYE